MSKFPGQEPPIVIVPELFRVTGGVQIFSQRMIEALDALFGSPVPVISRNDRAQDCPESFLKERKFTGCGSLPVSLRRFGIIAATALKKPPLFLSTHPHFTPWLKTLKPAYLTVAHGIDVWNIKGTKVADGLSSATRVLPVSRYTEQRMKDQLGSAMPDSTVFPNTFNTERFTAGESSTPWRDELEIPAEATLMLSMCRVSKSEAGKGYHRILELMPELVKKHPNLYWVLGGKGDDLETVREKAKILGVKDHCRFPGFVPDETLPDLYRSADLFVLPSKKEGFGIVFLEAAATGLPVIAGNKDGSVDALADGALGTLIDPEDNDAIARAISEVISAPAVDREALHLDCATRFGQPAFQNRLAQILSEYFPV